MVRERERDRGSRDAREILVKKKRGRDERDSAARLLHDVLSEDLQGFIT